MFIIIICFLFLMFDFYFGDLEIFVTPSVMYTMVDKGSSQFRGMHSNKQYKTYVEHKGRTDVEVLPISLPSGIYSCDLCMTTFTSAQGLHGHLSSTGHKMREEAQRAHGAALKKRGSNSSMDSSPQSRSIFSSVASPGASMIHLLICDL